MISPTYAVELLPDDSEKLPCCSHGPALLFRRVGTAGKNSGRPFYACSACRDRKKCKLFLWKDISSRFPPSKSWYEVRQEVLPRRSHEELYRQSQALAALPPLKRVFCCRRLLTDTELHDHRFHASKRYVSDDDLRRPSRLLQADVTNSTKAQFFFNDSCVTFLINFLQCKGFDSVICVGTPSIHEQLRLSQPTIDTILLDIEQAYEHFYSPDEFCWFNMFNNFFFRGDAPAETVRRRFVHNSRCALLIDPPFGGLVDAIARTLRSIMADAEASGGTVNVFWFFPYFNEKRIVETMPNLRMLDYMVDYRNHTAFKESGRVKGSPVRIFTNMPPNEVPLPADQYTYCEKCARWVNISNRHCDACGDCTSKDGGLYKHCNECGMCTKESYKHCATCWKCLPQGHACGSSGVVCFVCKSRGHKSTACSANRKKAAKRKAIE